ncbi:hypothetical protein KAS08_00500 [Candidatus Pacearchaeota archaeon]|nr:hypothetical protein [Candidatus Pacearchaeota archaeon]
MERNYGREARVALNKARECYIKYITEDKTDLDSRSTRKLINYQTKFFDPGKKAGFKEGILKKMYKAKVLYGVK